mmetsp:Transcript_22746/g.34719  ORF Transcript_22746/g.34719 Transcript_22746/m.34719 type:complete len:98 (-) Transcript_22746:35-328(-)
MVNPMYTTGKGKGVGWNRVRFSRFNASLRTVEKQRIAGEMKVEEKSFTDNYGKKFSNNGMPKGVGLVEDEMIEEEVVVPFFELPGRGKNSETGVGDE